MSKIGLLVFMGILCFLWFAAGVFALVCGDIIRGWGWEKPPEWLGGFLCIGIPFGVLGAICFFSAADEAEDN